MCLCPFNGLGTSPICTGSLTHPYEEVRPSLSFCSLARPSIFFLNSISIMFVVLTEGIHINIICMVALPLHVPRKKVLHNEMACLQSIYWHFKKLMTSYLKCTNTSITTTTTTITRCHIFQMQHTHKQDLYRGSKTLSLPACGLEDKGLVCKTKLKSTFQVLGLNPRVLENKNRDHPVELC